MSMRNSLVLAVILGLLVIGTGYAQTDDVTMADTEEAMVEVTPAEEAIAEADMLTTTPEKISYLLEKANALYSSEEFQGAVDVAQYILDYLDAESQEAKDLLSMAKEALVGAATEKIEDAAMAVEDMTKGMTEKVGM